MLQIGLSFVHYIAVMIGRVPFDRIKGVNAMLYILNKCGEIDRHRLLKILYFAEQDFMANEGFSFIGGKFVAMPKGPVHSEVYDIIQDVERNPEDYTGIFEHTQHPNLRAVTEANLDELSVNYMKYVDSAIAKYRKAHFNWVTLVSHDKAWGDARKRDRNGAETMDLVSIAKVKNPDQNHLDYLRDNLESLNP